MAAGKSRKTTKQADRVADAQHASDMEEQDDSSPSRVFEPFSPTNYGATPYVDLYQEWDDGDMARLSALIGIDLLDDVKWGKVNNGTHQNHTLTTLHHLDQFAEGFNIFLKQLGGALSTSFSPITIKATTKEDLEAMKRHSGKARAKVDVSRYTKGK